jgi:hypothetical protein
VQLRTLPYLHGTLHWRQFNTGKFGAMMRQFGRADRLAGRPGCFLEFSLADLATQGFAINRLTRASSAALDSLFVTH